ncbi:GTP-binding protein, partial [Linderina macrospora]
MEDEFIDTYYPTVELVHDQIITVKGVEYKVHIIDSAGQDEFSLLDTRYAVDIDVYVIAFSVVARKSFEMARIIRDKILDLSGTESVTMVLVGNKIDLKDQRVVSFEEADAMAKEFDCPYIETSAKTNNNISELFVKSVSETTKQDGETADGSEGGN